MKEKRKADGIIDLDDVDKDILNLLNEDGRMSYRKISRKLNVSIGTVHNRIEKLIKTGVIKKFVPVIDHDKLGYKLTTVIGVRVKGGVLMNWEDKIAYHKNVICLYDVTGEYDAIMITKFRDTNDLDEFIKGMLKEKDTQRTNTQTVLNIVKEDFNSVKML